MTMIVGDVGDEDISGLADTMITAGFSPSDIPGLILWLDADHGVTLNGANVSAWLDRSSSAANFVQATGANQPKLQTSAINGHAAIRANDSTDRLVDAAKPDLSSLAGFTMFAVFRLVSVAGTQLIQATGGSKVYGPVQFSGNVLYHYAGAAGGASNGTHAFTDTTGPHITETLFDGSGVGNSGRLKAYLDGTAQTLTYTGTVPATTTTSVVGLDIGAGYALPGGDLPSILIYNRALTAGERSRVGQWLAQRYAITTTY